MIQLPALNTPQFRIVKSRMPRTPQPVPPIYQPEIAADAIVWMAGSTRRELYVTSRSAMTIWGDKLAPGLLDRYLARGGYDAQMTDEPSTARGQPLEAARRRPRRARPVRPDRPTRDRSTVLLRHRGGVTGRARRRRGHRRGRCPRAASLTAATHLKGCP
jgi:hypothetical protein